MQPGPDKILECPHCSAPSILPTLLSGNTIGATFWSDGKMVAPMLPDTPEITKCYQCGSFFWIEDAQVVGEIREMGLEGKLIRPPIDTLNLPGPIHNLLEYRRVTDVVDLLDLLENSPELLLKILEGNKDYLKEIKSQLQKKGFLEKEAWSEAPYIEELTGAEYFKAIKQDVAKDPESDKRLRILAWWRENDHHRVPDDLREAPSEPINDDAISNIRSLFKLLDEEDQEQCMMKAEVARQLGNFRQAMALLEGVDDERLQRAKEELIQFYISRRKGLEQFHYQDLRSCAWLIAERKWFQNKWNSLTCWMRQN
jgi:hypothetical protein